MYPRLLSIAHGVLLCGCVAASGDGTTPGDGATSERGATSVVLEAIPSPAGADSGEPFLSVDGDGVLMSWLEAVDVGEGHELRFARWDGVEWSAATTIERRADFFVNWADFPSVRRGPDGTLWAHWLERGETGGYDYGVRIVRSDDGGATWSEAWTPHEDDSPTEHGFVSAFSGGGRMGFAWLDGRRNDPDAAHSGHGDRASHGGMTLRFRDITADGEPGRETLLDDRVCDCCQTASALSDEGPLVVYRDRSEAEVRDISVVRLVDGAWTEPVAVHRDGWEIDGCPVNGPDIAALGRRVAVTWFTAPDDRPRVNLAFSNDAGAHFTTPVRVDDGDPAGRVDVALLADGSALVTWIERTGGDRAEVRARIVDSQGGAGASHLLSATTSTRPSGFPRIADAGDGSFLMAWTDVSGDAPRVLVQRVHLEPSNSTAAPNSDTR